MSPAGRWIRLDTTWSQSEWLARLPPAQRLAWVELLCYVKAHGVSGEAKRVAPFIFARQAGLEKDDVEAMEAAAMEDGALIIEAEKWCLTGWGEYQADPTAAARMRRYRERQQQDTKKEDDDAVTDVTRNGRIVTDVTPNSDIDSDIDTDTVDADAPTDPKRDFPARPKKDSSGNYEYPEPFERAWAAYPDRDGSNPKVGAYSAFRARVARGAVPDSLVTAAEHYRTHCQAREIEGTPYVQQAATFWGPKEPWREFLESPQTNGKGEHWTAKL